MGNILTERELFAKTDLNSSQLQLLIENEIIRPIETFGRRFIFPKKHVDFLSKVKQLISQGIDLEQIKQHVNGLELDVDEVLNSQHIEERSIEYFQSLSYNEIIERCQEERIVGFRRMTREEMEIALAYPEQREELAERVRERNRQRSRQQEEQVQQVPVQTTDRSSVANLPYRELVQMAKDARVTNFRRMTKDELIIALTGTEEEVRALIEMVRERTRQRYGSGARTSTRNQQLSRVEQILLPHLAQQDEQEIQEEPEVIEEETTPVVLEETQVEEVVETNEVPYTLEELQAMNAKQVAVVVRDYIEGIKYFRRMTKEELIICIFEPERREEMMENALARYERYRGRRYGSNNR